jgi:YD repeat-containing protein
VAALDSGGGYLYKYEYDAYGNVTTKWNSAGGDALPMISSGMMSPRPGPSWAG